MKVLAIIGAGSWGSALAIALSSRFVEIRLWTRGAQASTKLSADNENRRYLPGFPFPPNVTPSNDLPQCLAGADIVIVAVPSAHLRAVLESAAPLLESGSIVVSATKGLESTTLLRMSEVIAQSFDCAEERIAVLSGPTFAHEIAAGEPAAVVVASASSQAAERLQAACSTAALRLYTSSDVAGVEIGAALKNVIAIGAGVCRGLGLGSNSVAALVTRGLAEITRLAVELGGDWRTLSGLAGLGDLVLTATGDLSRNRYVGIELGRGRSLTEILSSMKAVAEGVGTCKAAYDLGRARSVSLPIVKAMYELLYEGKNPRAAIKELMDRPLRSE